MMMNNMAGSDSKPAATPTSSSSSAQQCPTCAAKVSSSSDVFCRACGGRILLKCSKCGHNVRARDKYCASCGVGRWYILELFRNNVWHQSPLAKGGVVAAVGALWLALYLAVKHRVHADRTLMPPR